MIYTENLDELIFNRHSIIESDELIILTGYVGPQPVERLKTLPLNSKVIYGMYGSEGIKSPLHNTLVKLQNNIQTLNIYYSILPVHSKIYVWRYSGRIVHALVGSANFSTNGLTTAFRELLAETTTDSFNPLNSYIQKVLNNSICCLDVGMIDIQPDVPGRECLLSLLSKEGEVQNYAGLNWGQNPKNHTTKHDSYIAIRKSDIREYPELFPPKQEGPVKTDLRGKRHRHNDYIEIIWDDGVCMDGLFFGNQEINGIKYPKQVSSFPHPAEMGKYLRKRLGISEGQPVRKIHLNRYGRDSIGVTLLNEGVYKFDFSV